jgi:drug/metabolite transporter (DMT)-like permease
MSILIVIFMYAIWSTVFSFGKMALEVSPPLFLTACRFILAGVLFIAYLALRNRAAFKINLKHFFLILGLAVSGTYLTNAFEFSSLRYLTAAKTCFIYSLCPFLAAFFSYLHFNEKMNPRKWLGLLIGFAGIVPVLMMQKGSEELISTLPFLSWPELAMVGASICTVYGWILLRVLLKDQVSIFMANGTSMLIGGGIALIHSCLTETWSPLPVSSSHLGAFLEGIIILTFISNILGFNLYGLLLKKFTATFLSFMGLLSPIFASISSWIILNEPLSPILFVSTGIVSIGAWLVYSAELRQGYVFLSTSEKKAPEIGAI